MSLPAGWEILFMVLYVVVFAALVAFFLALIMRSSWFTRRMPGAFRPEAKPPGKTP